MTERSAAPITIDDLARLAELARANRDRLFVRHRLLGQRYAKRVLCVALCQGAALHYVDGRSGVKDFDVWTFYAAHRDGPFPSRRVARAGFGPLQVRAPAQRHPPVRRPASRPHRQVADAGAGRRPVQALRRYLSASRTASARALARKAVVLVDPAHLRGVIAWPVQPASMS